ncbi:MAG: hypothetical protein ACI915_000167 [Gammaproteobacteria bacterium]|jgi:hypothetical protein
MCAKAGLVPDAAIGQVEQLIRRTIAGSLIRSTSQTFEEAKLNFRRIKPFMSPFTVYRNIRCREIRIDEATNGNTVLIRQISRRVPTNTTAARRAERDRYRTTRFSSSHILFGVSTYFDIFLWKPSPYVIASSSSSLTVLAVADGYHSRLTAAFNFERAALAFRDSCDDYLLGINSSRAPNCCVNATAT